MGRPRRPRARLLRRLGKAARVREVLVGEMQSATFPPGGLQGKRGIDPQGLQAMTLGLMSPAQTIFLKGGSWF